jgi:hypothetical protein
LRVKSAQICNKWAVFERHRAAHGQTQSLEDLDILNKSFSTLGRASQNVAFEQQRVEKPPQARPNPLSKVEPEPGMRMVVFATGVSVR